jgi:hypothetical protein
LNSMYVIISAKGVLREPKWPATQLFIEPSKQLAVGNKQQLLRTHRIDLVIAPKQFGDSPTVKISEIVINSNIQNTPNAYSTDHGTNHTRSI